MIVITALMGLVIGSFANVCILRSKRGESLLVPSHCPHCNHQIAWYDLLPVVSFLNLRGQCRRCKNSISILYPLVEAFFCIVYPLIYWHVGFSLSTIYLFGLVFFLGVIAIGDILFMEIDDRHIFGALLWIGGWSLYFESTTLMLAGAFAGLLLACSIYGIGRWFYSREVFGSGDILLSIVVGAAAGYEKVLPIYIATWSLMLILAIFFALIRRRQRSQLVFVPFAPVMVAAWAFICFFHFN